MSADNHDKTDAMVALVSGALIGIAAAYVFIRIQRSRKMRAAAADGDYSYDGGDLFV